MEENTSQAYVEPADALLGATPGSGSPLFVINLCASMAPTQLAGKSLPGLESYRLYQVSRVEDGRTRYRLRLGFFTSEESAEIVLSTVRADYATAFTACLADEDRKFARDYLPAAPAARPRPVAVATVPAPQPAKPAVAAVAKAVAAPAPAKVAPKAAARPPVTDTQSMKKLVLDKLAIEEPGVVEVTWEPEVPAAAKKTQTGAHKSLDASIVDEIELSWEPATPPAPVPAKTPPPAAAAPRVLKPAVPEVKNPPVIVKSGAPVNLELEREPAAAEKKAAAPASTAPAQPFHVGKGVEIPNVALSLQQEAPPIVVQPAPAGPAPKAAPAARPAAEKPPTKPVTPPPAPVAAPPTPVAQAKPTLPARVGALPDLDSTQTIRALTSDELNDGAMEKWFAIQLAVSEQPVNLDAMPHLDIFEAYRLYSVASAGSGKIVHSLRLGFFREAVSAEAVSGYLKTFFPTPSVLRISGAEHERFKDAPTPKVAPAVENKVVDLNHARERARPVIPTVTMEVAPPPSPDRSPSGAFRTGSHAARPASQTGTTGKHKALEPTLKPAKAAAKSGAAPVRRSAPLKSNSNSGRYRAPPKLSLQEQLLEEAREVELSESGIRRMPKSDSLLSRLVDKLKK